MCVCVDVVEGEVGVVGRRRLRSNLPMMRLLLQVGRFLFFSRLG